MLVAQITDFHVGAAESLIERAFDTSGHLSRAIDHLLGLDPRPDVVVGTGDLVDAGSAGEYARLAAILGRLPMPCYLIPGNHDDRDNLRRAFADRGYLPATGFLCYAVDLGPLRLLALDTNIPGQPGGRLCRERLAWLDAELAAAPDRPAIVIMHHPPFETGMACMDGMSLDGSGALADVVSRHPQVERILCGHLHRPIVRRFAGTVASTCPSTAHQVELDLRPAGRLAIVAEPPACQLHLWDAAAGGLVSHTSYINSYGQPFVVSAAH